MMGGITDSHLKMSNFERGAGEGDRTLREVGSGRVYRGYGKVEKVSLLLQRIGIGLSYQFLICLCFTH